MHILHNETPLEELYTGPASSDYSPASSANRFKRAFELFDRLVPRDRRTLTLLDYGCGPGNLLAWMKNSADWCAAYHGHDLRRASIAHARSLHRFPGATFSHESPPMGSTWGLVLALGTVSYQLSPDEIACKSAATDLLAQIFSHATAALVFTLPRADCTKTTPRPMLRFTRAEADTLAEGLAAERVILDAETFPHEFLVGVGRA